MGLACTAKACRQGRVEVLTSGFVLGHAKPYSHPSVWEVRAFLQVWNAHHVVCRTGGYISLVILGNEGLV